MPRRTKKTIRHLAPIAKKLSKLGNQLHSLSRLAQNLAIQVTRLEGEVEAYRKRAGIKFREPETVKLSDVKKRAQDDGISYQEALTMERTEQSIIV